MSGPGGGSGFKGSSTETPSQTVGDGGFYIKDQGSADANKAGYGQLWIKTGVDAAPNDLYFVNEDGQAVRITNGSSIAAAAGGSVAADDINAGDNSVSISTTSGNITLANSLTASDGLLIPDDTLLRFGAGSGDATIEYDEDGTNQLRFAGASAIFEQHVTASNSLEIRGNQQNTNLIVTGSSLMMGTGSAYTLVVSGGLGLLVESTNEPGDPNELDDRAVLTLKDAGNDGDTDTTLRAYIQAIDHTDDTVWRIGDARNGDKNLELLTQVSIADVILKTKSSDGGAITLSPRENVAFDIRPEGDSTFSGSVTIKDRTPFLSIDSTVAGDDCGINFMENGTEYWQIKHEGSDIDNSFVIRDVGVANVVVIEDGAGADKLHITSTGVGIGDSAPGTLLQVKGADAYLTLQNSTAEFSAGSCETKVIFEDHGNNALGQIEVSHAGGSDDENGQMILSTNNNSGLQPAITISNSQVVTLDGGVSVNKNSAGAVTVNTPADPTTDPHGTVSSQANQRAGTFVATMAGGFTFSNGSVISIQVSNNLVAGDDVIAVTATTQAQTGILAGCIAIAPSSNFFRIGLHNVGGGAVIPTGTVTVNWVIL